MKNKFVHYGFVLLFVAAFSAGLLGLVNSFTDPIIKENKIKAVNLARKQVLPTANDFKPDNGVKQDNMDFIPGYNEAGDVVGYVTTVASPGYAGDIVFVMGITKEGKVSGINIISSQETPGLGAKISGKPWQDHWKGRNLDYKFNKSVFNVVKNHEGDAFAGATISPRGVYTGIIKALNAYKAGVMK